MSYVVFDNRVTVFSVKSKCPKCKKKKLFGYNYSDQNDTMQHTHYVCTFWASPKDKQAYLDPDYDATKDRCDWHGWSVPGWDD